MGYQLVFWQRDAGAGDARSVYEALIDERRVEGLRPLPIGPILSKILSEFPDAVRGPNGPSSEWIDWVSGDGTSSFQVQWSDEHVLVECRGVSNDIGNRIVDALDGFDCPLYDPQTNERFDAGLER